MMASPSHLVACLALLIVVAGCTQLASATPADSWISTRPASVSRHFFDESGRVRIFHGSNRVWKASPWYFVEQTEGDDEFELMQGMGFNMMRLGWMWSGWYICSYNHRLANWQSAASHQLEHDSPFFPLAHPAGFNPAPGVFNYTYANIQLDIVKRMNAKGIYVLLDMHEDVLSSKYCLYDGAPLWVVNKSTPKHAFPWPLKGNCSSRGWMENILSEAAGTAYQDLYDNVNVRRFQARERQP